MKNTYLENKMAVVSTITAIAEGLWNGMVISGVLLVSAVLIKYVSTFYFNF
jgi:hypothetical protein